MKNLSTSKESLELLFNIKIILSSNIELLQKQQFVNYLWKT